MTETEDQKEVREFRGVKLNNELTSVIREFVEKVFARELDPFPGCKTNPITDAHFVLPDDSLEEQIEAACRALLAREYFHFFGPKDAPALPIGRMWDAVKYGARPLGFIVASYEALLSGNRYDPCGLPDFVAFARHMMAFEEVPDFVRKDARLLKAYPPKKIPGFTCFLEQAAASRKRSR